MNITHSQYENARRQLEKLAKHQETVKAWDGALKTYKAPEGQRVVEIEFKDGRTRFTTEAKGD